MIHPQTPARKKSATETKVLITTAAVTAVVTGWALVAHTEQPAVANATTQTVAYNLDQTLSGGRHRNPPGEHGDDDSDDDGERDSDSCQEGRSHGQAYPVPVATVVSAPEDDDDDDTVALGTQATATPAQRQATVPTAQAATPTPTLRQVTVPTAQPATPTPVTSTNSSR